MKELIKWKDLYFEDGDIVNLRKWLKQKFSIEFEILFEDGIKFIIPDYYENLEGPADVTLKNTNTNQIDLLVVLGFSELRFYSWATYSNEDAEPEFTIKLYSEDDNLDLLLSGLV